MGAASLALGGTLGDWSAGSPNCGTGSRVANVAASQAIDQSAVAQAAISRARVAGGCTPDGRGLRGGQPSSAADADSVRRVRDGPDDARSEPSWRGRRHPISISAGAARQSSSVSELKPIVESDSRCYGTVIAPLCANRDDLPGVEWLERIYAEVEAARARYICAQVDGMRRDLVRVPPSDDGRPPPVHPTW